MPCDDTLIDEKTNTVTTINDIILIFLNKLIHLFTLMVVKSVVL